ncbi:MAG: L,D-transpeptidase family protein [Nevskiales bacterium]
MTVVGLLWAQPIHAFDPTLMPVFADRVVVKKAERRLYLYKGTVTLATYPVNLGKNPRGHKRQVGDSRTPEGRYVLDHRKPDSDFHLALHVSYPSAVDRNEAEKRGVETGGNIMIHGLPNWYKGPDQYFPFRDWTDGCIALGNRHMELLYDLVPDDTPIEILP